jgi:hypothetical protein
MWLSWTIIAHQAKKGSSEIKVKNRIQRPLTIVNINFQSIKNKKPELDILLDTNFTQSMVCVVC